MEIRKYILPGIVVLSLLGILLGSCLKGGTMDSLLIAPVNPTIATGTTQQFAAVAHFTDGTVVNWTSGAEWTLEGDTSIATISETLGIYGLVTGASGTGVMSNGTFTVTARDTVNNLSDTTVLTVAYPVDILVSSTTGSLSPGAILQLTAEAKFSGVTATQNLTSSPTISWTSDNDAIAKVSAIGGLVTAATGTSGSVIISATYMITEITGTIPLTVQ